MQERAARSYRITAVGRRGTPIIDRSLEGVSWEGRHSSFLEEGGDTSTGISQLTRFCVLLSPRIHQSTQAPSLSELEGALGSH